MIHEYVEPARFVAGTVGPPGQRTFFLQAHDGRRTTSVSLEKAQVAVLAERLEELLDTLVGKAPGSCRSLRWFPQTSKTLSLLSRRSTTSFASSSLSLMWDDEIDRVVIEAHSVDPDEEADEGE